jgi:hypothetical protein
MVTDMLASAMVTNARVPEKVQPVSHEMLFTLLFSEITVANDVRVRLICAATRPSADPAALFGRVSRGGRAWTENASVSGSESMMPTEK